MTVTQFTASLTAYVKELLSAELDVDWERKLVEKIDQLAITCELTARSASFVLGEEILDSNVGDLVDAQVQANFDDSVQRRRRRSFTLADGGDNLDDDDENDEPTESGPSNEAENRVWQRLCAGTLKPRELERHFDQRQPIEAIRSVRLRRRYLNECVKMDAIRALPYRHYDYSMVYGACCENVFGYVPLPTGLVGPLRVNGADVYVPMSTTEGALVASANRGCKALNMCGGVEAIVDRDGMTRAPVLRFDDLAELRLCLSWLQSPETLDTIKSAFDSESRFARLQRYELTVDEPYLFVRFVATTGDAMGMNMVTKCSYKALNVITGEFKSAAVISISGNMCVDKKASLLNWERGRGKSVTARAIVPASAVRAVFRIEVGALVELAHAKFKLGARHAGCIGGANAHAANVVAAIFLATGQDAAQVVSSSMCSTSLRRTETGDLSIRCRMPCLEVGTVGGGTVLPAQSACLKMLDCQGGHPTAPSENAKRLAKIICATVLAGELSLLASQCAGDLMTGHIKLNRSSVNLASASLASLRFAAEPASTRPVSRLGNQNPADFIDNPPKKRTDVEKTESGLSKLMAKPLELSISSSPSITVKLAKKLAARCDHLL